MWLAQPDRPVKKWFQKTNSGKDCPNKTVLKWYPLKNVASWKHKLLDWFEDPPLLQHTEHRQRSSPSLHTTKPWVQFFFLSDKSVTHVCYTLHKWNSASVIETNEFWENVISSDIRVLRERVFNSFILLFTSAVRWMKFYFSRGRPLPPWISNKHRIAQADCCINLAWGECLR